MTVKSKTHKRLIIETDDRWLYQLFGLDSGLDDANPMVITKESIDSLEEYLVECDDDVFEECEHKDCISKCYNCNECRMSSPENKEMFNKIKEALKEYKEVQVVYNKELK